MENTCSDLLALCLRGEPWPLELLDRALEVEDGRTFLAVVVERLGDLFEPKLCAVYDHLFTQAVERVHPALLPRLRPAPEPRRALEDAQRVYVLSRVTLGADVAVTSVLLDAAKRRNPEAEIFFVGPRKNYELFEADPRIRHFECTYARGGSLRERLETSAALWFDNGLVLDPDSRLTQLGLIRVCPEERYLFFPSRSYGCDTGLRLPELAAQWAGQTMGVRASAYVAPRASSDPPAAITVSLGVGGNAAKRIEGDFERDLLRLLADTGASVLVDKGAGEEERVRVESAVLPGMRTHEGAFAPFAAQIARSRLYVGYDSAGGHVASACGVPLISIAKGFASPRAQARWRPQGHVIAGDGADALAAIREILATCTFRR